MSTSDLVASLYEAAVDPDLWTEALSAVCREFGASTGILMNDPADAPGPTLISAVNWSTTALKLYSEHYGALDPYQASLRRKPAGAEVVLGQDIISAKAFESSPVWTDYSSKQVGAFHFIGASLAVLPHRRAGIGLQRPKNAEPFDERARFRLTELARHLESALRMATRLDHSRGRIQAATLDSLVSALIVVSTEGRVFYANRAASLLEKRGPLKLGNKGAQIEIGGLIQTAALMKLVRNVALGGAGGDMQVVANAVRWACSVTALPRFVRTNFIGRGDTSESIGLALVTIRQIGAQVIITQDQLSALFGLTRTESAIVPYLLAGETANRIARRRSVSPATIQTQIRQVLAKTEAANLRALSALLIPLGK